MRPPELPLAWRHGQEKGWPLEGEERREKREQRREKREERRDMREERRKKKSVQMAEKKRSVQMARGGLAVAA